MKSFFLQVFILCNQYIICLKYHRKTRISLNEEDPCEKDREYPINHIPLDIILPRFPYLTEIRINFGQIYMNDGFEWKDFE